MFPSSLLTALLLALSIAAVPLDHVTAVRSSGSPVSLPFAKRISAGGGIVNLVEHDQARAAALRQHGTTIQTSNIDRRASSIAFGDNSGISYTAAVGVGSPATVYHLLVDTGSSNTWVGAGKPYTQTSTSRNTGQPVVDVYGINSSSYFSGEEWTDTVTFSSELTITNQSIGVASSSSGFSFDGVLGIGPEGLTQGTLTNETTTQIPTVTKNLYNQGKISQEVIGVSFAPTTEFVNGELTFGGVDSSKYTGSLTYTPITTTFPASHYWGIDQSITYGSTTILAETAGIVDTGTTLIFLASDAYAAYQSATGATYDDATQLLRFTTAQYDNLKDLNFNIGSVTYALTRNAQIWPRALNTYIGGASGAIYSIVGDLQIPSGSGFDFVNGLSFLERFYSVFDTTNSRVGFATTTYTDATTN